ncbi:MAG: helix-turn-helix domain-containing protein [Candidatus Andersenbacteria bacterium]|nr:helix-turn-helix domain-containing protein [Candidatus Andersenbacteria bacterium]MBI3250492.1 helix-turn-helix domain-containing protein [Candidatus Andersenbacteria bacterium]
MKAALKAKAISLRKLGRTYPEISKMLGISKSTCSVWLGNVVLGEKAKRRIEKRKEIGNQRGRKMVLEKKWNRDKVIHQKAERDFSNLTISMPLGKLICSALYWSEGEKGRGSVAFMNSDPEMIALFLSLLRACFVIKENKFRAQLHLHSYHNQEKQIKFWSKLTKIPSEKFYVYRKKNSGKNKKEGYPGCISVRYYDVRLYKEIESFYKLLARKFTIEET